MTYHHLSIRTSWFTSEYKFKFEIALSGRLWASASGPFTFPTIPDSARLGWNTKSTFNLTSSLHDVNNKSHKDFTFSYPPL